MWYLVVVSLNHSPRRSDMNSGGKLLSSNHRWYSMIVPRLSNEAYWNRMENWGATISCFLHLIESCRLICIEEKFQIHYCIHLNSPIHVLPLAMIQDFIWFHRPCFENQEYAAFLSTRYISLSRISVGTKKTDSKKGFKLGCVLQSHAGTLASLGCSTCYESRWGVRVKDPFHQWFEKVCDVPPKRGFVSTSQACRIIWCKTYHVATRDCKSLGWSSWIIVSPRCPSWLWSYHSSRKSSEPVEATVGILKHTPNISIVSNFF